MIFVIYQRIILNYISSSHSNTIVRRKAFSFKNIHKVNNNNRNPLIYNTFYSSKHWLKWLSEAAQSCPTLYNPMDCSPPGSSVHGILQARILEWVAISFSRGSSRPRDRTQVSRIAGSRFNLWATREAMGTNAVSDYTIMRAICILSLNHFLNHIFI